MLQLLHKGYPARVGYAIYTSTGTAHYEEDLNSAEWSVHPDRLNVYRLDRHATGSLEGFLFYQLDDNPENFLNPKKSCTDWYNVSAKDISVVCCECESWPYSGSLCIVLLF